MPSTSAEIRAWALMNGHQVGDRGRLPDAVVQAYEASQRSHGKTRTAATPASGTRPTSPAPPPDSHSIELAERITALEETVAGLMARLDAQPPALAPSVRRGLRRRN